MKIAPFKIERYYARYEFTAPYMLSSSDCESMTIRDLLALEPGAAESFDSHWLGYTEAPGSPELRQAITSLYTTIAPKDLLVFTGAEEGIFTAMNALLDRGDHVIVHAPAYQSLYSIAEAIGCEVSLWLTDDAAQWELDLDWLRDHIRPTTRMIVINSPHNPTGYLLSPEKQAAIIGLAREHGIIVFSDEVYRGLEHDPASQLPAACDLYERALSLGVLSKTYGLPGLRIGWIATRDADMLQKLAQYKDFITICNSAPSEFLATVALRHHGTLAERSRAIIRQNLDLLDRFFARYPALFVWQRPRSSATAFPRLRDSRGAERFALEVVEGCGVLLLPSTAYGYGDSHFRVGFGRANMAEAVVVLERFLGAGVGEVGSVLGFFD